MRAIDDVEMAAIAHCHRDFLLDMQVYTNLVVPILTEKGLWGLLVAYHRQASKRWTLTDVERMKQGSLTLSKASSVQMVG